VLTVPNLLSLLRLAGVPLFLWLLLGPRADGWALLVLAVGGFTDWLDGKLARLLGQYSTLGALLDPAVDRLYILAALVALGVREVVPWWAVVVLVGRDLVLGACLPVLRARGYTAFRVTYLGKSATFLLLYAFPLLLLGAGTSVVAPLARPFGYAFTIWGTALYLYSGLLYLAQFVLAMRRPPPAAGAGVPGPSAGGAAPGSGDARRRR
jgi:cardiolipin synthase (CMP-forming)